MITRPEDKEASVDADLKEWKLNYAHILDDIESKAEEQTISSSRPFKVQIIKIDGTQHPDVLIKDALNRIEALGAGWTQKLVQPKVLPSVDNKGKSKIIEI